MSEELRTALEAIRDAHKRDPDGGMGFKGGDYTHFDAACDLCGTSDEYAVEWPCWTHKTASAALAASGATLDVARLAEAIATVVGDRTDFTVWVAHAIATEYARAERGDEA